MPGALLMKHLRYFLPALVLIFSLSIVAQAQRGGRGGNGGDGDNTPIAPRGTVAAEFTFPFSGTPISLPDEFPSRDEIQELLSDYDLPFSLEDLDLPASSPEAYAAIVTFGQNYLGIRVDPFYAGSIPDTGTTSTIPAEVEAMSAELPSDLQAILDQLSGTPYWSIYENGAAIIYLDADCNDDCSLDMDSLQLTLENGSFGLYTTYEQVAVTSEIAAQNLVLSIYPALSNYTLTPYSVSTGYAFIGTNITTSADFSATGFIAGVTSSENGKALTYVIFGVGEGYVSLIR